jgi:hypothetical protein
LALQPLQDRLVPPTSQEHETKRGHAWERWLQPAAYDVETRRSPTEVSALPGRRGVAGIPQTPSALPTRNSRTGGRGGTSLFLPNPVELLGQGVDRSGEGVHLANRRR